MPRKRKKTPGVYARVAKRSGEIVYDAVVTVEGLQKTKRSFPDPDAAVEWQEATRVDMRRGVYVSAPGKLTLNELLLTHWLPAHQSGLRPNSVKAYRWWSRVIDAELGQYRVAKLTKLDVSAFKTRLERRYAPTTAACIFTCLRTMLAWALEHELVARDPTTATKAPRRSSRNPPVLQIAVIHKLQELARAAEEPAELMVWLAMEVGLRFGEIVSLGWDQIDVAERTLRLNRQQAVRNDGTVKTEAGERALKLTADAIERLQAHRQQQMAAAFEAGVTAPRLVLLRPGGFEVKAAWWWWKWNAIREGAGVPWLHFHDLRHVNATLMARAGIHPKVAQERLGHSSFGTTMRIYTHVTAEQQDEAAEALQTLLKRP